MSVKDYVDVNGNDGELARMVMVRVFESVRAEPRACERCGYDTDADGSCVFCGHLNRWSR